MKQLATSLLLMCTTLAPALAQTTIDAKDIVAKINHSEAISYQNATITGDLDLTSLANRKEVWDGNQGAGNYLSVVNVPLSFRNCTFKGKFLAYRTEDQDGKIWKNNSTVYNTDFTEAVVIEGCQFLDDAAFKYSTFSQRAVFVGNTFSDVALFKYAKFRNTADFSDVTFRDYADFKYTMFDQTSTFQKTTFERTADFKYTKFDKGVNFQQTRFSGNADFKYTHLPRGSNFDNTRFYGLTDFKYTTLDGQKFLPTR